MTDQTADYRTVPPSIEPVATAWQAWWEDHDMWDGDMLYADLDIAKHHSAVAYVGEEYAWLPGDDPDDEAPETVLAWELKYGRWRLLDAGQDTGVRLGETRTYATPAGQAPATDHTTPSRRAGLRDEIAAALEAADYRMDMRRGDLADAVLPVLYREWPWLRAEAEDAAAPSATAQTALRDRIAAAIAQELTPDGKLTQGMRAVNDDPDEGHTTRMPRPTEVADAITPVLPASADRAAVLREAADRYEAILASAAAEHSADPRYYTGVRDVILGLRRMAAEPAAVTATPGQTDDKTTDGAACVCGHPMRQHFEDVCLLGDCGCADGLEIGALPEALKSVLTKRFTELGNPYSEMRRHEQGPDGWPSSHPVGPNKVAEVLRELITRTAAGAQPVCAECGHPNDAHREGDDPVTPGICGMCETSDPDDAHHDYEPAAAQQPKEA